MSYKHYRITNCLKIKSIFNIFGGENNKIIQLQLINLTLELLNYQHMYVYFQFGTEFLLVL
jgi:hypothetical protein